MSGRRWRWWRGQGSQRERSLHALMAMNMGWSETHTRTSWAMCDVQEMSVKTQNKDYEDCNTTRTLTCSGFMLCFVLFYWILAFTLSLVSDASTSSKMVVNCTSPRIRNTKCKVLSFWMLQSDCVLSPSTQSVSQILAYFPSRKRVFWGVVFTPPVGYSRPPSAVNDLSVTK